VRWAVGRWVAVAAYLVVNARDAASGSAAERLYAGAMQAGAHVGGVLVCDTDTTGTGGVAAALTRLRQVLYGWEALHRLRVSWTTGNVTETFSPEPCFGWIGQVRRMASQQ
jgi:hypothetical protein